MTQLDDILVPKVLELLERFGASATLTTRTKVYNNTTGITAFTPVDTAVRVSPPQPLDQLYTAGDVFKIDDVDCIVSSVGLPAEPVNGDRLTLGTKTWQVISVGTIRSGDQICAYQLVLRK